MLVDERRNLIRKLVMNQGSVKVNDLVQQFQVSEETIRRDLNLLESEGLVKKNYGGAILVDELRNLIQAYPPVNQRQLLQFDEKNQIGMRAAQMVQDDQVVILDAGTTTLSIARHLKQVQNLTIVTNGVNLAEECSHVESASIYLVGGKLIRDSMSLVGPQAQQELQKYTANIVFLGTTGISLRKGFTSSDIYEAEVKRVMVSAGEKVVIVADHSKFDRHGFISFGSFEDVDTLITSDQVEDSILKEIERMGVEIIVCPTFGDSSPTNNKDSQREWLHP